MPKWISNPTMRVAQTSKSCVGEWLYAIGKTEYFQPRMRGESIRSWLNVILEHSLLGNIIDVVMIMLSLLLVLTFIVHNWEELQDIDPPWMKVLEIGTGVIFTVDYITRFYAAVERFQYVIGFFSIVDLLTVAPVWIELALSEAGVDSGSARTYLRPIRVLRALRVLRAYRILNFLKSEFDKQLFLTLLMLVSIILCSAGIVQAIELCEPPLLDTNGTIIVDYDPTNCKDFNHPEPCCQSLSFYTLIYFIIVTITTVGKTFAFPKYMPLER
jgi:hypothetical protein